MYFTQAEAVLILEVNLQRSNIHFGVGQVVAAKAYQRCHAHLSVRRGYRVETVNSKKKRLYTRSLVACLHAIRTFAEIIHIT
jgi:hypothetical protein